MAKIVIMVVSADFYGTEKFVNELESLIGDIADIQAVHRTYHAENAAPNVDIIVGDYTCKERDEHMPYGVVYSHVSLARHHGKKYFSRDFRILDKLTIKRVARAATKMARKRASELLPS